MRKGLIYFIFIALTLGCGLAVGLIARPDGWYAALVKPSFNPPNWIFAPVWTTLYVLIGIAGARTYLARNGGLALWIAQFVLNLLWSPAFFGLHSPGLALAILVPLLLAILAFLVTRWNKDRVAAALFIPYAAWVSFAGLLNASIVALN